eukprot:7871003-Pyramimonas_sp.AAC.1
MSGQRLPAQIRARVGREKMPPKRGAHDQAGPGFRFFSSSRSREEPGSHRADIHAVCCCGTAWDDWPRSNPTRARACFQHSQVNADQKHDVVGGVLNVKSGQPASKLARAMGPRVFAPVDGFIDACHPQFL